MATANPSTPTFSQILLQVLASGTTLGTKFTLDLKTKFGAFVVPMIGRRGATALTRPGYIAIRRTQNDDSSNQIPSTFFDFVSSIATVNSTTVSSGGSSGTNTVVLASGTGFAAEQWVCLHSDDTNCSRVEFVRTIDLTSATIAIDRNFKVSHNASDRVTNGADVSGPIWLPGGDIYEFGAVNNSGQALLFQVLAQTYDSDTIA